MTRSADTAVEPAVAVRPAAIQDVEAIFELLADYARMGNLLPRSRTEIAENIEWFRVAESGGKVVGCGALEVFTPELAEIRSLVGAARCQRASR